MTWPQSSASLPVLTLSILEIGANHRESIDFLSAAIATKESAAINSYTLSLSVDAVCFVAFHLKRFLFS